MKLRRAMPLSGPTGRSIPSKHRFVYSHVFLGKTQKLPHLSRLALRISGPLLWFITAAHNSINQVIANGLGVKREYGVTYLRQLRRMISISLFEKVPPGYYYYIRLYERKIQLNTEFLINKHLVPIYSRMLANKQTSLILKDKSKFNTHISVHDDYLIEELLRVNKSNTRELFLFLMEHKSDIFLKPVKGYGGSGTYMLSYLDDQHFLIRNSKSQNQLPYSEPLIERIIGKEEFIVQERLKNHDSLNKLTNGYLASARITTVIDENGQYQVCFGNFLMPTGNIIASNKPGLLAAAIDIETGRLGNPVDVRTPFERIAIHPDTKVHVEGNYLPTWDNAKQLVLKVHHDFSDIPIIGWDVAFTSQGLKLLEGNLGWSIELVQFTHREKFDANGFISLLHYHLKRQQ